MITMTITMISMMSITFHNVEPFITTYLPTCAALRRRDTEDSSYSRN